MVLNLFSLFYRPQETTAHTTAITSHNCPLAHMPQCWKSITRWYLWKSKFRSLTRGIWYLICFIFSLFFWTTGNCFTLDSNYVSQLPCGTKLFSKSWTYFLCWSGFFLRFLGQFIPNPESQIFKEKKDSFFLTQYWAWKVPRTLCPARLSLYRAGLT